MHTCLVGIRETALCAPLDVPRRSLIVIGIKSKFRTACEKKCCMLSCFEDTTSQSLSLAHTEVPRSLPRGLPVKKGVAGKTTKPCVVLHLYCWH